MVSWFNVFHTRILTRVPSSRGGEAGDTLFFKFGTTNRKFIAHFYLKRNVLLPLLCVVLCCVVFSRTLTRSELMAEGWGPTLGWICEASPFLSALVLCEHCSTNRSVWRLHASLGSQFMIADLKKKFFILKPSEMWTRDVGCRWCRGSSCAWPGVCCRRCCYWCCPDESRSAPFKALLCLWMLSCVSILFLNNVGKRNFFQLIILMGELDPGLLTQSIQKYPALRACMCVLCVLHSAGVGWGGSICR